ncbi:DUF2536 family protein [Priestia taiwanensis]|uniref:DUF2536 domain-containing protein n=1 Tax=Priestia taiwanensis TaxID=1347902 RepID=A0A917AU64_9BACI|nr:DUF2536 family protein [Priestia taiwanensis]MBM7363695.1 hypothetical protein [Priestia taiwanensis]GGE74865.1 hypothetical protein GCM10007140_25920 [Priestia taiwanensis]
MQFSLDIIEDKVEFFEATNLQIIEKMISEKIDQNRAIFLQVHHVSHQMYVDPATNYKCYSAVVHFKAKK